MTPNPFRYFRTSPELIQSAVMMYVRSPLSPRNVEDLLHERGIYVCDESVRLWGDRFAWSPQNKFGYDGRRAFAPERISR